MRPVHLAACLCLLSLVPVEAVAQPKGLSSFGDSKNNVGPFGMGTRHPTATFGADGAPRSLKSTFSIVVPNVLTMRNLVLFERTRDIRITPRLGRALRSLRRNAYEAGVGLMQASNKGTVIHWQRPRSIVSNIETVGSSPIGGIRVASPSVKSAHRAAEALYLLAKKR